MNSYNNKIVVVIVDKIPYTNCGLFLANQYTKHIEYDNIILPLSSNTIRKYLFIFKYSIAGNIEITIRKEFITRI